MTLWQISIQGWTHHGRLKLKLFHLEPNVVYRVYPDNFQICHNETWMFPLSIDAKFYLGWFTQGRRNRRAEGAAAYFVRSKPPLTVNLGMNWLRERPSFAMANLKVVRIYWYTTFGSKWISLEFSRPWCLYPCVLICHSVDMEISNYC